MENNTKKQSGQIPAHPQTFECSFSLQKINLHVNYSFSTFVA